MKKINLLLLVDDDEIFRFITQTMIAETKLVHQIKTFENGKLAIEFLKAIHEQTEELPDIILLDLTMPILDGWGFIEHYLELLPKFGKRIQLYVLSSSIDPYDHEKAKSISAVSDFVIKPITKSQFLELLKNNSSLT